jgi:hypothetical protein
MRLADRKREEVDSVAEQEQVLLHITYLCLPFTGASTNTPTSRGFLALANRHIIASGNKNLAHLVEISATESLSTSSNHRGYLPLSKKANLSFKMR